MTAAKLRNGIFVVVAVTIGAWILWSYPFASLRGDDSMLRDVEGQALSAEAALEEAIAAKGESPLAEIETDVDELFKETVSILAPDIRWRSDSTAQEWVLAWLVNALTENEGADQAWIPRAMLASGTTIDVGLPEISTSGAYAVFDVSVSPRDLPVPEVEEMLRAFRDLEQRGVRFQSLTWSVSGNLPEPEEEIRLSEDDEPEEIPGSGWFPQRYDTSNPGVLGGFVDCHPDYSPCLPLVDNLDSCEQVPNILLPVVSLTGNDPYGIAGCTPDEDVQPARCPTSGLFDDREQVFNVDPSLLPPVPLNPSISPEKLDTTRQQTCASVNFTIRVYVRVPDDLIAEYANTESP